MGKEQIFLPMVTPIQDNINLASLMVSVSINGRTAAPTLESSKMA